MDAITTYIDHMFRSLPATAEVRRARAELQQMSEDRYQELLAEGVSENEAVGRVITQFGNLDELADDLGIRREFDGAVDEADLPLAVSNDEAMRFLQVRRRASLLIGGGVLTILAGLGAMVLFGEGRGSIWGDGGFSVEDPLALIIFFGAIAIGVAMFIVAGMSLGSFSEFADRRLELSPTTLAEVQRLRLAEQGKFTASIAGGVVAIILGVAAAAIMNSLDGDSGGTLSSIGALLLFLGVGIGVLILVVGSMRRSGLDQLTAKGDYAPAKRGEQALIERIAGPYWMLALVVFLAWGFIGNAWSQSWIVWPIAGVTFGLVAATIEAFKPRERR